MRFLNRIRARLARRLLVIADAGMSTAEYAVGTIAAVAFTEGLTVRYVDVLSWRGPQARLRSRSSHRRRHAAMTARTRNDGPRGNHEALARLLINFLWDKAGGSTAQTERGWELTLIVGRSELVGEGKTALEACGQIADALAILPTPDAHASAEEWAWHLLSGVLDRGRLTLTQAVFEVIDPERDEDLG